ncbi:serine/threonine-protein kinase [Anaerotardibacter muris]|uniref:serine/threonine-protein kinase n=1 Tax=Anaerotardibacter muris TaxID=2941505 RepID=UPI00203A4DCD|nr:serine/threonine-protein kinase [Anaerotardibacter muris]
MSKDELEEYLGALDRRDCYRVDAVLKDSPVERTERVFFQGNNGSELGPFVRKVFPIESGQGGVYAKIFRAQQAGKRLAHIQHIHECYSTDSTVEVVVDYVEGQTLQEYVEENGPSVELASNVFPALCDAVIELHEAFDPPIIHRDLTPANIIVSAGGITVIDLGIARLFRPGAIRDTVYLGTRDFAPPEQFGFAQTDIRTDVYALGKILLYCLEGSNNEEVSKVEEHASGHSIEGITYPDGTEQPKVDPFIAHVIAQATNLDPEMRYGSVAQMKEAFLHAMDQQDAALEAQVKANATTGVHFEDEDARSRTPQPNLPEPNTEDLVDVVQPIPSVPSEELPKVSSDEVPGANTSHVQAKPSKKMYALAVAITFFREAIAHIPKALGIVWDVIVGLAWLLILAASFMLIFNAEGELAAVPLWFRAVEVFGIAFIPYTIVSYYVLDLRLIREEFPRLSLPSRRKTWYLLPAIVITIWLAVYIIAAACGFAQPTN